MAEGIIKQPVIITEHPIPITTIPANSSADIDTGMTYPTEPFILVGTKVFSGIIGNYYASPNNNHLLLTYWNFRNENITTIVWERFVIIRLRDIIFPPVEGL